MISDKEIDAKKEEFELRPLDVQKDYVYGWLLKALFQRQALASHLVLKGGNALRKGYLPGHEDFLRYLDFSAREAITQGIWKPNSVRYVPLLKTEEEGVRFIDKMTIRDKDLAIPDIEALEARLYFKKASMARKISA